MPTPRYYTKVRHANIGKFIYDFVRWLVNDHATLTGPRWEVIEAHDSASVSNETPSITKGPGTMSSFSGSGFSWDTSSTSGITTSDWIVLRTVTNQGADSFGDIEMEVYLEYASSTTMSIMVMPLNNFVKGYVTSPPTFPTGAFGAGGGTLMNMVMDVTADYYAVGDEGMFALVMDDGNDPYWTYCGELDGASIGDSRCFVLWDLPNEMYFLRSRQNQWTRLSPLNNSTFCTASCMVLPYSAYAGIFPSDYGDYAQRPAMLTMPGAVWFNTTSHQHLAGFMRNVYLGSNNMPYRGVLGDNEFVFFCEYRNAGDTFSGIVFRWDGSTGI